MDPIPPINFGTVSADAALPGESTSESKDMFLKLLVAQLRYQDPMAPTDSMAFVSQSAQFTSLEKLEEIATAISAMSKNDDLATIGNLVGKNIQYRDSVGSLIESRVTAGKLDDGIVLIVDGAEVRLTDVVGVVADSVAA